MVVSQFRLTHYPYQRLAIRLRIAGREADVHRGSDENALALSGQAKTGKTAPVGIRASALKGFKKQIEKSEET